MKTQIERDYEWFDPNDFGDPNLLVRFESRPVIIAESVRTQDGQEIVSSRPAAGGGTRHGDAPAAQHGDVPEGR